MTIHDLISKYQSALTKEQRIRDLPYSKYQQKEYYHACDMTSYWVYKMINHPDWTAELQDEFYPSIPGEIAYPVSC